MNVFFLNPFSSPKVSSEIHGNWTNLSNCDLFCFLISFHYWNTCAMHTERTQSVTIERCIFIICTSIHFFFFFRLYMSVSCHCKEFRWCTRSAARHLWILLTVKHATSAFESLTINLKLQRNAQKKNKTKNSSLVLSTSSERIKIVQKN